MRHRIRGWRWWQRDRLDDKWRRGSKSVELDLSAHHCGDQRDMDRDNHQHRIGIRLPVDEDRAVGSVSEHITLLHASPVKGMLHHYICSARKFIGQIVFRYRLAAASRRW